MKIFSIILQCNCSKTNTFFSQSFLEKEDYLAYLVFWRRPFSVLLACWCCLSHFLQIPRYFFSSFFLFGSAKLTGSWLLLAAVQKEKRPKLVSWLGPPFRTKILCNRFYIQPSITTLYTLLIFFTHVFVHLFLVSFNKFIEYLQY